MASYNTSQGHQTASFLKISVRWKVIRLPFSLVKCVTCSFRKKGKMNAYYFRRDKTAVLGAIKAQLPTVAEKGHFRLPTSEFRLPTSDFRVFSMDNFLAFDILKILEMFLLSNILIFSYTQLFFGEIISRFLKRPTSDFRLPTSEFRLPTSDFRLPTSDFRLPTVDF